MQVMGMYLNNIEAKMHKNDLKASQARVTNA